MTIVEDTILIKIGVSYKQDISPEELYHATSVSWKVSENRLRSGQYKYFCAVYKNHIKEVYELTGYEADTHPDNIGRFILKGKIADEGVRSQLLDLFVGEIHRGAGNPIKYTNMNKLMILAEESKNSSADNIIEKIVGESGIFTTVENGKWAFDFIHDMVTRLGIEDTGDERLAVTYRRDYRAIHINFCSWLLLGFHTENNRTVVRLPLTETNELEGFESTYTFARTGDQVKINCYSFPIATVQSLPDNLLTNYYDTLEFINQFFENQLRSQYRIHNQVELEQAIFNLDVRNRLLNEGFHLQFNEENKVEDQRYFWLTSNPSIWDVSEIRDGATVFYTAYNEKGNKRRIFNDFQSARPKDKILFYESTPRKEIVALGEVVEGLHYEVHEGFEEPVEGVSFKYIRDLKPISWAQIHNVKELEAASPVRNGAQGSLFELTQVEYETILALEETKIGEESDLPVIDFTSPIQIQSLHFEDEEIIIKQAETALKSGKNIILTGPPGTGKSKLAKEICRSYGVDFQMTTATSDWSTYETIGGYRPESDGTLTFNPGLFLSCFKDSRTNQNKNDWLIIDEINRADIDKAFGSLFSALTGDTISIPFSAPSGNRVTICPQRERITALKNDSEYIIPNDWRLIGTMNTFDKASLYEMSYAFMRRFAFIPVSIPKRINEDLVQSYLYQWGVAEYAYLSSLTVVWKVINEYRQIGPAIVKDLAKYTEDDDDFTSAIILYVMPQFEGLLEHEIIDFIKRVGELREISKERLLNFAQDFFQIKE